jgi:adenine/guanine phosphoribosyltransferase-like PRPP-binding protein
LNAAIELVEKLGGEVAQILLLNQITALNGISKIKLPKERVFSIYHD